MAVNSAFAYSHTVRRVSISVIRTLPKRMNVTLINAVISRVAALDFLFYDFLSNVCPTLIKKCFFIRFSGLSIYSQLFILCMSYRRIYFNIFRFAGQNTLHFKNIKTHLD